MDCSNPHLNLIGVPFVFNIVDLQNADSDFLSDHHSVGIYLSNGVVLYLVFVAPGAAQCFDLEDLALSAEVRQMDELPRPNDSHLGVNCQLLLGFYLVSSSE